MGLSLHALASALPTSETGRGIHWPQSRQQADSSCSNQLAKQGNPVDSIDPLWRTLTLTTVATGKIPLLEKTVRRSACAPNMLWKVTSAVLEGCIPHPSWVSCSSQNPRVRLQMDVHMVGGRQGCIRERDPTDACVHVLTNRDYSAQSVQEQCTLTLSRESLFQTETWLWIS
jgi:hypothetical protein